MRNAALLLLLLAPALAAADPDQQRHRTRVLQTLDVVGRLQLDNATTKKLVPVLSSYTRERDRLLEDYISAERKLDGLTDPKLADQVLDDMLATQSALVATEAQLVVRLRKMLPAEQAAKARVLLAEAHPRAESPAPVALPVATATATATEGYDPDALFPPGSTLRGKCDPFASMHGCRY